MQFDLVQKKLVFGGIGNVIFVGNVDCLFVVLFTIFIFSDLSISGKKRFGAFLQRFSLLYESCTRVSLSLSLPDHALATFLAINTLSKKKKN
jgi:hypothetical protein